MRERLQSPLPIWIVQYQLLGGHRRLIAVAVAYTFALIIAFAAYRRLEPTTGIAALVANALQLLAAIQCLIILFGGCNAVHRAGVRDFGSKMLESHRLTPLSNVTVAIGYIFGATLQTLSLFVCTALFGGVLTLMGGYPVEDWLMGHMLLLSGAAPLWAMTLLVGLRPAKPIAPAGFLVVIGLGAAFMFLVPALAIFSGVSSATAAYFTITGSSTMSTPAEVGLLGANIVLLCFWISTASAKYRRPDLPALNGIRGLVLLVLWLITSCVVLGEFHGSFRSLFAGWRNVAHLPQIQWISALVGGLVIAGTFLVGTVYCRTLAARGTKLRDRMDNLRPLHATILATSIICIFMLGFARPDWAPLMLPIRGDLITGITCFLTLWIVVCLFDLLQPFFQSKVLVPALLLFAYAALPPIIDTIRAEAVVDYDGEPAYSWIMGLSPVGTITVLWYPFSVNIIPGLVAQSALAAALTVACWLRPRRHTQTAA